MQLAMFDDTGRELPLGIFFDANLAKATTVTCVSNWKKVDRTPGQTPRCVVNVNIASAPFPNIFYIYNYT